EPATDRWDAAFISGLAYMQLNKFQEADAVLRVALPLAPDDLNRAGVLIRLGYLNYKLRLPLRSKEFYEQALAIPGSHRKDAEQGLQTLKAEFKVDWK